MSLLNIIFIAVGLAMDALAVSIASGTVSRKDPVKAAWIRGALFGFFQMAMPLAGWAAGATFRTAVALVDHWIAFGILALIGAKMIYESVREDQTGKADASTGAWALLGLALATSMDALAVGLGFAFLDVPILVPAVIIGAVTFVLSFAGVLVGARFGGLFEKKAEALGGVVLILIGCKILWEHLAMSPGGP